MCGENSINERLNSTHVSASNQLLTAEQHGEDGEDLLGVGDGRHVAEPDTGEYCKGEVERSDIA